MRSKDKPMKLTKKQKLLKAMEFSIGGVKLYMIDNIRAEVEGCKSIVAYDEWGVKLLTDKFVVGFEGSGLQITRYDSAMTIIEGFINTVQYERG
ncbi:MAG: YabP/YqfC family sporulation protein [Clostridia bacterium]|nr:YabP/YqfC family sporulation protein [Clostridia bacterium]